MDKGSKVWFNKILACGEWGSNFAHEGIFLGWGVDFEECKDGVGNFTIALVKLEDGTIEKVPTEQLKFAIDIEDIIRQAWGDVANDRDDKAAVLGLIDYGKPLRLCKEIQIRQEKYNQGKDWSYDVDLRRNIKESKEG